MTIIRTTVARDAYERGDARAKAEGTNLAAVLRTLYLAWLDPEPEPESTFLPLTATEKQEVKMWLNVHSGGTGPGWHKDWRARADAVLRKRGVDLPPLPPAGSVEHHEALLRWMHAADPHLSVTDDTIRDRPTLPRAEEYA